MADEQLSEIEQLKKKINSLELLNRTLEQQNSAFSDIEHSMQEQLDLVCADYAMIQPRYERYVLKFGDLTFDDLPKPEAPKDSESFDLLTMLRVRNRAMSDSIIKLQDENKALQAQLEQEHKKKSSLALEDVQRIRTQLEAAAEEKKKHLKALAQAKTLIDSLTQQLATAKTNISTATVQQGKSGVSVDLIRSKDKQIQDLMQQITSLNDSNTSLLENAHELQESLDAAQESLAETKTKAEEDLQKLKTELETSNAKRQDEIKLMSQQIKETKELYDNKLSTLAAALEDAQASLKLAAIQNEDYKQQIDALIKYRDCCNSISSMLTKLEEKDD